MPTTNNSREWMPEVVTPPNATLLDMVDRNPPPQSWYNDETNPFEEDDDGSVPH